MLRSPSASEASVSRRPPDLVNGSRFFRGHLDTFRFAKNSMTGWFKRGLLCNASVAECE